MLARSAGWVPGRFKEIPAHGSRNNRSQHSIAGRCCSCTQATRGLGSWLFKEIPAHGSRNNRPQHSEPGAVAPARKPHHAREVCGLGSRLFQRNAARPGRVKTSLGTFRARSCQLLHASHTMLARSAGWVPGCLKKYRRTGREITARNIQSLVLLLLQARHTMRTRSAAGWVPGCLKKYRRTGREIPARNIL